MREFGVALALLGAVPVALAEDCPLERALYAQPDTTWEMRFSPVPDEAASNQLHAFSIASTELGTRYLGGVYVPNGFTPRFGVLDRADCTPQEGAGQEYPPRCRAWEGPVYMSTGDGIDWLAGRDAVAPPQILLPGFGEAWWYSDQRDPDNVPADIFTFRECLAP